MPICIFHLIYSDKELELGTICSAHKEFRVNIPTILRDINIGFLLMEKGISNEYY